MNYLDIFIATPFLWGIFKGFKKGLIVEIASLIGLILGIYASINFSYYAEKYIAENVEQISSTYLPLVSFCTTFLIVVIGINLLAKVLEKMINIIALGFINKLLGSVFGSLKNLLITTTLLLIFDIVIIQKGFINSSLTDGSMFYQPIVTSGKSVFELLKLNEDVIINWIN